MVGFQLDQEMCALRPYRLDDFLLSAHGVKRYYVALVYGFLDDRGVCRYLVALLLTHFSADGHPVADGVGGHDVGRLAVCERSTPHALAVDGDDFESVAVFFQHVVLDKLRHNICKSLAVSVF